MNAVFSPHIVHYLLITDTLLFDVPFYLVYDYILHPTFVCFLFSYDTTLQTKCSDQPMLYPGSGAAVIRQLIHKLSIRIIFIQLLFDLISINRLIFHAEMADF